LSRNGSPASVGTTHEPPRSISYTTPNV